MKFNKAKFDKALQEAIDSDSKYETILENCGNVTIRKTTYLVISEESINIMREIFREGCKRYIEND